jgi:hypothetical protein
VAPNSRQIPVEMGSRNSFVFRHVALPRRSASDAPAVTRLRSSGTSVRRAELGGPVDDLSKKLAAGLNRLQSVCANLGSPFQWRGSSTYRY